MENISESANDFQDWEVIQSNSDSEGDTVDNAFDEIETGGLIQANYFSLNRPNLEELDDSQSAESDNPSWIDPGMEESKIRYPNRGFWSDSNSELSDDHKIEMIFSGDEKNRASIEGIGEVVDEEVEKSEELANYLEEKSDVCAESNMSLREENEANSGGNGKKMSGENEGRNISVMWWKMPVEFLRYCVFKMSPVWTVSMAAAVMGIVILTRRLYKMKRKAKGLKIKVTFDDKKASQVLSRVARLNEAFSLVKRVPMIRPPLPGAVGITAWPAMSLG